MQFEDVTCIKVMRGKCVSKMKMHIQYRSVGKLWLKVCPSKYVAVILCDLET